ncbi:MAG: hypothetical protein ACRDWA_17825 [Acidimicrobiia bacterium]
MESAAIVLSVDQNQTEDFEMGFRENELPTWHDFYERGIFGLGLPPEDGHPPSPERALSNIWWWQPSLPTRGIIFMTANPRFRRWDQMADTNQVGPALAFGGETILSVGFH